MLLNNILCKTNNFQRWDQKCLIRVILGCKFEKLLPYLKSESPNLSNAKFCAKIEILKFGPKKALFEYF